MGCTRTIGALGVAAVLLTGCATGPALPPPPVHPNGLTLWRIVSEQCAPDQVQHASPAPCAEVSTAGRYAVLKDTVGPAQFLVLPTDRITGIEDPALLTPGGPNYFAAAWAARTFVEMRLGKKLARDQVAVAVNSRYGRSQDQLHLHVDCLAPGVAETLTANRSMIGPEWSSRAFTVGGHAYRIRRIEGDGLAGVDPFRLLAEGVPSAARAMGAWTLALVGTTFADGRPGFYLLAGRADPLHGDPGSAEVLQDHDCKVELAAPAR
jgi:CDP-diacylglycerol pyrophosphatase